MMLFGMVGAIVAQPETHTLNIAYSPTYEKLVQMGVVKTERTTCDMSLIALSSSNDRYHHISYSFYHSDLSGYVMNVVTALFYNDSEIASTAFNAFTFNGTKDTGYDVPACGGYHIVMWAFDDHSNFLVATDTLWQWVSNVTEVYSVSVNENPSGVVNLFSLTGQKIMTFNSVFDKRKNFPINVPFGIYIMEFISPQKYVTEKIGVMAP